LDVLGAIIVLATPLPAGCLAALLGIEKYDVNHWLNNLHAVLNVPSDSKAPVRLRHKSFSDFLRGQEGTGMDSFRINAVEKHAMLASKCIDRMKRENGGLRKDICNLQDYGKPRDKIGETTIREVIRPDLKYAYLNWVYHLQQCRQDITDEDIYAFLREHFLHWLEALSLIKKMTEGVVMVRTLESMLTVSGPIHVNYVRVLLTNFRYVHSVYDFTPYTKR
jgi:hypothetical protein